jgi:hypothetical protein
MKSSKHQKTPRHDAAGRSLEGEAVAEEGKEEEQDARGWPSLPLKGGGDMDVSTARAWEGHLRRLTEENPNHFDALISMIYGNNDNIDVSIIQDLKAWRYLKQDGSVNPDIAAVMKAGFRATGDGPCIVDPIAPATSDQAAALKAHDDRYEARMGAFADRIFDEIKRKGKDPSGGRE